jgi:hypothetical protein
MSIVMKEQDYDMLRGCYDPETAVIILDLGLVYGVTIVNDLVGVKITLMSIQHITSRIEFLAELLSAEADRLAKQIIFFCCKEGTFDVTPKTFICLSNTNSGSKETHRMLKKQRRRRKLCHTH